MKIYYPAGDRTPDLLNQRQTCYHLSQCGELEKSITRLVYQDTLEQYLYPQVGDLQPQVIFQQDGTPPHWSMDVLNSPTKSYPDCWIGRGRPICWQPSLPDITPLDFFLWGYVKDRVFAIPVQDLHIYEPVSLIQLQQYQWTCYTEHCTKSNADLILFVLPMVHTERCLSACVAMKIL